MELTVLLALVAIFFGREALAWIVTRRNNKPKSNPVYDPHQIKMGDMSVSFWAERFDKLEEKLDEIVTLLGGKK